jgi:dTDP-3-amino-3,4,6-trideoxy-alpha-D-glucose transaminase
VTPRIPFNELRPGTDAGDIRAAIDGVIERGWYILGPELEAFEREFARAAGAARACGVANGTDAITLLLRACGVRPGDEVIVPAITAGFTGLAVQAMGAVAVIADVDPETLTLTAEACQTRMTPRVRAIVPVHLYGQPADMDPLLDFARRHSLVVVEDCCQAHLATSRGRPVGTMGAGGAFSFYPTKNLGALGDGGAIVTNDERVAERVILLRNGGQAQRHDHVEPGVNSRLDEMQAAILRARLPRLPEQTARRRAIAARYHEGLPDGVRAVPARDAGHVYHLFPVRTAERDRLRTFMADAGIETLVHYPRPLSAQAAFAAGTRGACPVADRATAELLSLPLHPQLPDEAVEQVLEALRHFV